MRAWIAYSAFVAALAVISGLSFLIPNRQPADNRLMPDAALVSLPPEITSQPVFNDWLLGGYMIFSGYRPFIDGRAELFGKEFIARYLQIVRPDYQAMQETFSQYGIVWTITPHTNRLNELLALLPEWCLYYSDSDNAVFVRHDALAFADYACPIKPLSSPSSPLQPQR